MYEELWTALYLEPFTRPWEVRMRIDHVCTIFTLIYKLSRRLNNGDEVFIHVYNSATQNPPLVHPDSRFIPLVNAPLPPFPIMDNPDLQIVGKLMFQKHIAQRKLSFKNFQLGATSYCESINEC